MIIWIVIGILALCVGLGILWGFLRGLRKSWVRLVILLIACIITVFITKPIAEALVNNLKISGGKTLGELIQDAISSSGLENILQSGSYFSDLINKLPIMIGSIFVFLIVFFILKYITLIIYAIVMSFIPKTEKKRRGFGALTGLVSGLLIFFMIMVPVSGLIDSAQKVSDWSIEIDGGQKGLLDGVKLGGENAKTLIDNYQNSGLSGFSKLFGAGTGIFNYITTQTIGGENKNLLGLIDDLSKVVNLIDTLSKLQDFDFANSSIDEMLNYLQSILGNLSDLPPAMLDELAQAVGSQFGPEMNDVIEGVLNNLDSVQQDLADLHGILDGLEGNDLSTLSSDDADALLTTLSESPLLDILVSSNVTIPTGDNPHIEDAIQKLEEDPNVSSETITNLKTLFGIPSNP